MKQEPVDIKTQIAQLNLLDHREMDWERVERSAYLIHQHFRYDYPGPIHNLKQRLLIVPPDIYGDQRYIVHHLDVSSDIVETSSHSDEFGNRVIELLIPSVEQSVDFEAWIIVERSADKGPFVLPRTVLSDPRYLEASPLTQPDDALREVAVTLAVVDQEPSDLARSINDWVYRTFHYTHDVTDIHTTASQALALR